MDPEDFRTLEELARRRGASVGDLMREATQAQWFSQVRLARRADAARRFLGLPDASMPDWRELKTEIEDRRG